MSHGECLEVPLLKAKASLAFPGDLKKRQTSNRSLPEWEQLLLDFIENLGPPGCSHFPVSRFAFSVTVYLSLEALRWQMFKGVWDNGGEQGGSSLSWQWPYSKWKEVQASLLTQAHGNAFVHDHNGHNIRSLFIFNNIQQCTRAMYVCQVKKWLEGTKFLHYVVGHPLAWAGPWPMSISKEQLLVPTTTNLSGHHALTHLGCTATLPLGSTWVKTT